MWAVLAAAIWVCALATPQPLHLERDSFRRPRPEPLLHLENSWQKRDQNGPQVPQATSSQLMLRSPRGSRQYDVPQIGEYPSLFSKLYTAQTLGYIACSQTKFWSPYLTSSEKSPSKTFDTIFLKSIG